MIYYHATQNCESCSNNIKRENKFPFYCKKYKKETGMLVTCKDWKKKE